MAITANAAIQPSEWHSAGIRGHKIHYALKEGGALKGNGPALVLLHGGGDSGENSFARQLDFFAQNHRIVVPDQVGQGRTPDADVRLTYGGMMQDTAALLQHLGIEQADIIGFSDGGILALMLAVRHPELVRRVIVSGVNISPEGLQAENLQTLRSIQNPWPRTIDEKLAHLWLTSPTEEELSLAMLAKIQQSVLVICGDRDAVTLEHTVAIFHALPRAELCVLPGTHHGTFSSRPEWLNPILGAFLQRP